MPAKRKDRLQFLRDSRKALGEAGDITPAQAKRGRAYLLQKLMKNPIQVIYGVPDILSGLPSQTFYMHEGATVRDVRAAIRQAFIKSKTGKVPPDLCHICLFEDGRPDKLENDDISPPKVHCFLIMKIRVM